MEDLLATQKKIVDTIEKLYTNFKKDGSDRKTPDYIQRRLETLELYWKEFQANHITLCGYGIKSDDYFSNNTYEVAKERYEHIRSIIKDYNVKFSDAKPASTPGSLQQGKEAETSSPWGKTGTSHFTIPGRNNRDEQDTARSGPSDEAHREYRSQGVVSKTEEMLRIQASQFRALERTIDSEELDESTDKCDLEDLLHSIKSRWSAIDALHLKIDAELEGENQEYYQAFNRYYKLQKAFKKEVNSKISSIANRVRTTPQLELPTFTGSYNKWASFRDIFIDIIHNNPALSEVQKLQFLKCKLKGEPETLIQHLEICEENYEVAWSIIKRRYNNIKLIFKAHVNALMEIPNKQPPTMANLKKLHDLTTETVNAVRNLQIEVSSWDFDTGFLLVHILCEKLDNETYNEFNAKRPRDLQTLKEFLGFLEDKFTSMQTSRKTQDFVGKKPSFHINNKQPVEKKQTYFKTSNNYTSSKISQSKPGRNKRLSKHFCPLCNSLEHRLYFCPQFKEMPPQVKYETVGKLKVCENCLNKHEGKVCISNQRCTVCNGMHNTYLHEVFAHSNYMTSDHQINNATYGHSTQANVSLQVTTPEILLATAMVKVQGKDGSYHKIRALIDQGSQTSLITEKAAQLLGLRRKHCQGVVSGIGEKENNCKGLARIQCASTQNDYVFETDVIIMNTLIKHLPGQTFSKPLWPILNDIALADPEFNISRPVDLLFGADIYGEIILDGIRRSGKNLPIAQQTLLGWILCGNTTHSLHCNVVINNIEQIQQFWQIEDISGEETVTSQDKKVMDYYNRTTIRRPDGRYEVRLPLKSTVEEKLGESRTKAVAQFKQLERKFSKQENVAREYKLFIKEYLELSHMVKSYGNKTPEFYLPHHCVIRADSLTTKLRVVYNASSRTASGLSLNDLMDRGPNLQLDLQNLIIKWRQYEYAFTADVEKMFRQVWVNKQDQKYQKIIWRDSPTDKLETYQLTTVTYGTKAAPFLAMMTLRQLAKDERSNYRDSNAPEVVESSFYMDDLVHCCDSREEAERLLQDITKLMKSGGFNLRKWKSNVPNLFEVINHKQEEEKYDFKMADTSKTLGVSWNTKQDSFGFSSEIEWSTKGPTKRTLLSDISKLFDPLGWLSPITTKLKILFQQVWQSNINWDDTLPENIQREWNKIKIDLRQINQFKIPRWLGIKKGNKIELYGFSDASIRAYSCVVYCKPSRGEVTNPIIIAGKTRLVPLNKTVTLPKLELCGALLLTKLVEKINKCLENHDIVVYGFVDSMVVMGWLAKEPDHWKPFVANRVKQITSIIPTKNWRYVKSEENPADCASRGLNASQLMTHDLWWKGPKWLPTFELDHNKKSYETDLELKRPKQVIAVVQTQEVSFIKELLMYHSSFTKIINIVAWVNRFISNCKKSRLNTNYLKLDEISKAKTLIIKETQEEEYCQEIADLRKNSRVSAKSKIAMLNPYLDKNGLMRVGGRLKNAHISDDMKHPTIIPNNTRLSELIIDQCHELTFHGGARLTLSVMRQKYWLIGGIRATKKRVSRCVTCRKHNPIHQHQLMGDLPPSRVNPSRPWFHTGIDYTGHVYVKTNKGRGTKTTKGYIAVFICMATKAVHLELVSDLTTSSFLAALRRMSARRGVPAHMYSDQGTTFIGANKILQQEYEEIMCTFDDQYVQELTNMGIKWHFNAPSWPSAGGLWEAAVKSLKYHLKRVIGEQRLTYEEYSTLLAQLEACLNQRPLCPLTEDVENIDCLTPAHFLTNGPTLALYDTERDLRTRWHMTQKIFEDIWKRWRSEYLTQLSARSKWRQSQNNINVNDIVVIHDANLPAGKWALGRVIELHPGSDGLVRVVTLKTKNGIMKRPIVKLSALPVHEKKSDTTCTQGDRSDKEVTTTTVQSNVTIDSTRRKCSGSSFKTMAFSLLLFIMTLITSTHGAYNITTLNTNQSLYFDKVNNMYLIRGEWRLVVYYNMKPYWEGTQAVNKYIYYLKTICTRINDVTHCDPIILQLQHDYKELKYYDDVLMNKQNARVRRGLINGVGNIANSLFGVLDNNFAEKYEKDIELVRKNENHLALLWKNQTSLIEAEFNLLKRTENLMTTQHKQINLRLQELQLSINTIKGSVATAAVISDFTLTAMIANNILTQLKRMQDTLLDTLTDIYNGQLSLHLLTPDQLRHEIGIISSQIPKDLATPIDSVDITKIYHMLKIRARMSTNNLIFETRIPLINRDVYEVYHVTSIPRLFNERESVRIMPISNYLAINLKKNALLSIKESDLKDCLLQDQRTILCSFKTPVYHIQEDDIMCRKRENSNECKVIRETCEPQLIELQRVNNYLYFCCNDCKLKLLCEDQIDSLVLSRAGVITISHGCVIKFRDYTIYTHEQRKSDLTVEADLLTPELAPINHMINITIPLPATEPSEPDMTEHRRQMTDIEQKIHEMKNTVPLYRDVSTDTHHYVIIYVLLSVITIVAAIIIVVVYRRQYHSQLGGLAAASRSTAMAGRAAETARAGDAIASCSEAEAAERSPHPASRARSFVGSDSVIYNKSDGVSILKGKNRCSDTINKCSGKLNKETSPIKRSVYFYQNNGFNNSL